MSDSDGLDVLVARVVSLERIVARARLGMLVLAVLWGVPMVLFAWVLSGRGFVRGAGLQLLRGPDEEVFCEVTESNGETFPEIRLGNPERRSDGIGILKVESRGLLATLVKDRDFISSVIGRSDGPRVRVHGEHGEVSIGFDQVDRGASIQLYDARGALRAELAIERSDGHGNLRFFDADGREEWRAR